MGAGGWGLGAGEFYELVRSNLELQGFCEASKLFTEAVSVAGKIVDRFFASKSQFAR